MGGNAMKDYGTVRLPNADYEGFLHRLLDLFQAEGVHFCTIPYVLEKQDFGDVDIIVNNSCRDFCEEVIDQISPAKKVNGNVTSFIYENVQVDFIYTPAEDMYFSVNYFSYNDLGNLMGRVAHKLGLKLGHDGLWLPVRDGDNKIGEILLTKNYQAAISYLGFDLMEYNQGFDTFDQMFEFVAKSHYFNPEIYLLENRNHTARVRDRKRKTYMMFLDWCEQLDPKDYMPFKPKHEYLPNILVDFRVTEQYEEIWRELAWKKFLRSRYPADRIRELTGLEGKQLGAFIKYLKTCTSFNTAILSRTVSEMDEFVIAHNQNMWEIQ